MNDKEHFSFVEIVGIDSLSKVSTNCNESCNLKTKEGELLEVLFYSVEKTSTNNILRVAGSESLRPDFVGYLDSKTGTGKLIFLNR